MSEITGSVLDFAISHKNGRDNSVITCLSNIMVSITQTLAQIKPQEFIDHTKQDFMTTTPVTCHQWLSRCREMLCEKLAASQPSTRQHANWFNLQRPLKSIVKFIYLFIYLLD